MAQKILAATGVLLLCCRKQEGPEVLSGCLSTTHYRVCTGRLGTVGYGTVEVVFPLRHGTSSTWAEFHCKAVPNCHNAISVKRLLALLLYKSLNRKKEPKKPKTKPAVVGLSVTH